MANKVDNLLNLKKQFLEGTEINPIEIINDEFLWKKWLKERKQASKKYMDSLQKMGIKYNGKLLEVGKGIDDTLISLKNKSFLLTPFEDDYKKYSDQIILGNLYTLSGVPYIINETNEGIKTSKITDFNQIVTHNPYDMIKIDDFITLFETEFNVAVGIFGKVYDKDFEQKMNSLDEFRRKIAYNCVANYARDDDNYSYIVASKVRRKKR